jgi:hypothetical protein
MWAGQEVLKETFGKKAERHLGQYLETNLLHPHCVVLSSPWSSARATISHSFREPSRVCECAFASHWAGVRSADFAREGMDWMILGS